jgi:hypothetical protein
MYQCTLNVSAHFSSGRAIIGRSNPAAVKSSTEVNLIYYIIYKYEIFKMGPINWNAPDPYSDEEDNDWEIQVPCIIASNWKWLIARSIDKQG